jgi:hypothetical protein
MRNLYPTCLAIAALASLSSPEKMEAQAAPPLRLIQTIPIPHVNGRLDHMDTTAQLLIDSSVKTSRLEPIRVDRRYASPSHMRNLGTGLGFVGGPDDARRVEFEKK